MQNMGTVDRFVLFGLGVALGIVSWYWLTGWMMWIVYVMAGFLAGEAIMGRCILYQLIGIDNRHKPQTPTPPTPHMPDGLAM